MYHVAIMKKSWGFLEKIARGEKTIESRWYATRRAPWDRVKMGDTIYFKNSGEPVRLRAEVQKVLQFSDLSPKKVNEILLKYGKADGIAKEEIPKFYELFKDKRYCMLIYLKNPRVVRPFAIDKRGFGAMSAWVTTDSISKIKNGGGNRG